MRHLILRHVTAFIVIVTSIVAVSYIKNSKPQQTIPSDDEERVYMLVATPGAEGDFTRAVAVSDSLFADMLTIACVETGHAAEALDFARRALRLAEELADTTACSTPSIRSTPCAVPTSTVNLATLKFHQPKLSAKYPQRLGDFPKFGLGYSLRR